MHLTKNYRLAQRSLLLTRWTGRMTVTPLRPVMPNACRAAAMHRQPMFSFSSDNKTTEASQQNSEEEATSSQAEQAEPVLTSDVEQRQF